MSLDGVQLEYIDSFDKAMEFKRWLGERHGGAGDVLGFDTETTGLHMFTPESDVRLIQFGDAQTGWAMSWELWKGLAIEVMKQWEGDFVGHNAASFDVKFIEAHSDYRFPRHRIHDTMLQAHIIDPLGPGSLKPLSQKLIDPRAGAGQQILAEAMSKNGWDWATVPTDFPPYHMYGALDPVLSVRLHEKFMKKVGPGTEWAEVYDLELAVRHVVTRMEQRGMRVDVDYAMKKSAELIAYANRTREWGQQNYGINLGSGPQLKRIFQGMGATFDVFSEKTGDPSADKHQLAIFADDPDPDIAQFAKTILNLRKAEKLGKDYLLKCANLAIPETDGNIVHASMRTLAARTSRMCLPTTHELVTDRGRTAVDMIRVGDKTLDADGQWTTVQAVHRYADQPVTTWAHEYVSLTCTDEHRWVTRSARGVRRVEPLGARSRQYVQLAPWTEKFDFADLSLQPVTDGEIFAAIVGLLVTDGRCSEPAAGVTEVGMHAMIYQTEKKFYDEIRAIIPTEAITYDRVTKNGDHHHEIGLRIRWLRPKLAASGLTVEPGQTLKNSSSLMSWVLALPVNELHYFLRAIWLADGRTGYPDSPTLSCTSSSSFRDVVRVAAYRFGYSTSTITAAASPWGTQDRIVLGFKKSEWITRKMTRAPGRSDVWCVTTASGTFTAWSPEYGPYLTGNSISDPPLQQLSKQDATVRNAFIAREGNVLISTDFAQIELRLMAHFSKDERLIEAFRDADATGGDFFVNVAREVYQDSGFQKSDKRRGLVKSMIYGLNYGAGVPKMAETAGVAQPVMRDVVQRLEKAYPGIRGFMRQIEHVGVEREKHGGQGYVTTPYGRRLPCDDGKVYTLVNYLLQGHAAEYFKRAIVNLDAAGWGDVMLVPVHDEIVMDLPEADAEQAMKDVPRIMQNLTDYAVPILAESDGPYMRWGEKYS